jgi:hypothetical protein
VIPVARQPEPATFATQVRNPGRAFLRHTPRPNREEWKKGQFWIACLPDLRTSYRHICAYCCFWLTMDSSVDHYLPKSAYPNQAYEWTNFRLAHPKLNGYKADKIGLLDPFTIQPGWFILDFANCHVKPNPATTKPVQDSVTHTIKELKLNLDDSLVQTRFTIVRNYSKNHCDMDFLEGYYPFIASELKRQGLQNTIKGTIP